MTPHPALVDSHCHLDLEQFEPDRSDVLARAHDAGVAWIVNPGIDLAHSRAAIALAEEHAGAHPEVYAAVGVHPNSSAGFNAETLDSLRLLAAHPRVVAVGEIGLDYYWQQVEPAQQRAAFEAQLALAAEVGLPVIIHCRDGTGAGGADEPTAQQEVAAILRRWVASEAFRSSRLVREREFYGVLHAFAGDAALAAEAYGWGFVIGLGGPVTFRNARALHALVPRLRLDRLMLETDAPYLTPHPLRGRRNEPAYLTLVAEQLAALYNVSVEAVAQTTTGVAARFYGRADGLFDRQEESIRRADTPEQSAVRHP